MGQFADRDRRDFEKVLGAKHPDLIQSTDGHVSERAVRVGRDIDVVGDGACIKGLEQGEWGPRVKHLGLADVFQRKPDLFSIRRRDDVGTERTVLLDPADYLMVGDGNHHCFRIER